MTLIYNFTEEELKLPIEKMGLCTRATHTLRWHDVNTLKDLINAIETTGLMGMHNMGKTTVAEIMCKLESMQTPAWHEKYARQREIENKTAEIQAEIAKHYKKIEELNNCLIHLSDIKKITKKR